MGFDHLIDKRLKYLSGLKDSLESRIMGNRPIDVMKDFMMIDSDSEGSEGMMRHFIASSRENPYFKKLYDQIRSEQFSMDTLKSLDIYKTVQQEQDSFMGQINAIINTVDSRLGNFMQPLQSMPLMYTQGKLSPNCQALAQASTILYSYDNDIGDLSFGETIHTDTRNDFLGLLKRYKDLDDNEFYMVAGDEIISGDIRNMLGMALKSDEEQAETERLSHIFSMAGYGNDIKSKLLSSVLGLEDPHAIIVNNKTGEEYDAYSEENRTYIRHDIFEGHYFASMLNVLLLKNFYDKDQNLVNEYRKLEDNVNNPSYTLTHAGIQIHEDFETKLKYMDRAKKIFSERGVDPPAALVVGEVILHSARMFYDNESLNVVEDNLQYLQEKYVLDNALETIGMKHSYPILQDLPRFCEDKRRFNKEMDHLKKGL